MHWQAGTDTVRDGKCTLHGASKDRPKAPEVLGHDGGCFPAQWDRGGVDDTSRTDIMSGDSMVGPLALQMLQHDSAGSRINQERLDAPSSNPFSGPTPERLFGERGIDRKSCDAPRRGRPPKPVWIPDDLGVLTKSKAEKLTHVQLLHYTIQIKNRSPKQKPGALKIVTDYLREQGQGGQD